MRERHHVSTASRGASREHQVKRQLESEGWAVTRGAGSHGQADLWAAKRWTDRFEDHLAEVWGVTLRLIQVKTDKRGPFANFGPKARQELSALAAQTGGIAELWHWSANKPCKIYTEDQWPT